MTVSTSVPLRSTRGRETFYFCNPSCKARFDATALPPRASQTSARYENPNQDHRDTEGTEITETKGKSSHRAKKPQVGSSEKRGLESESSRRAGQSPAGSPPVAERTAIRYTCPMHPAIVQDGPGACPICGMALEPQTVTLDDGPNPELVDMQRRFVVSAILTVPLLASMWLTLPPWVQLLLAAPVVLWG